MKYIVILDSGNYVYKLDAELRKQGYKFEIVSTPCHVAKSGCGLCLKFPAEFFDVVKAVADRSDTPIREAYRVVQGFSRNRYERIL